MSAENPTNFVSPLFSALSTESLVKPQQPAAPATTIIAKVISGDNRIDPLLDSANFRFNDGSPVGTAVTVTYSFPTTMPASYTGEDALGWRAFSEEQKIATREILAQLQQQIQITFQEVTDSVALTGTMRFSNNTQTSSAGYAFLPNSTQTDRDADTWIAIGSDTNMVRGSYSWQTLVHEIGHAIGLNHPGNYNAGENKNVDAIGNFLSSNEDAFFNSIMSYRQSAQDINADSFMPYDMLALRYLYGTNKVATGDNLYNYTDTAGQKLTNIVDDGGTDTMDFSGVSAGISLNLTPGSYSSVGKLTSGGNALANLTTSFDAIIENAIGTAFADTMMGNAANNKFTGGAGNDTIDGAAGIDTAIYNGARLSYTVTRGANNITVNETNSSSEGSDTLSGVERLQFSNVKVAFDLDGNAGTTAKIIGAVLGRENVANAQYVGVGINLLDGGMSYANLMQLALNFARPNTNNADIVNLLYTNVVGTAPSVEAMNLYKGLLDNGEYTPSSLGILAAETTLNINNINLIGLTQSGIEYM